MTADEKVKRLMAIKKQIEEAKSKSDQLQGTLTTLQGQMKSQFGCGNVAQAKEKLNKMDQDLAKAERDLENGIKSLEASYSWT